MRRQVGEDSTKTPVRGPSDDRRPHASSSRTMLPETSVKRKSRP
jgi:hypothetical protein